MSTGAGSDTRRIRGGSLLAPFMLRATVSETGQLTRSMRWLRISGPALRGVEARPGQQVRVLVGDPFRAKVLVGGLGELRRTYSVYRGDPAAGEIELCVYLHNGGGPGARWAREAQPGQEVALSRPEGRFVLRADAPYHLFVGEETAMVPFTAMSGSLPDAARVQAVIELADLADRLPGMRAESTVWVQRGTEGAASSAGLPRAVAGLDLPSEPGVAYVAGEARTCQAVRDHLVRERGWPRRSVLVKPFWAPGKRGME